MLTSTSECYDTIFVSVNLVANFVLGSEIQTWAKFVDEKVIAIVFNKIRCLSASPFKNHLTDIGKVDPCHRYFSQAFSTKCAVINSRRYYTYSGNYPVLTRFLKCHSNFVNSVHTRKVESGVGSWF